MKKTLLQIVQSVMSDMNSDEINSISDSVEGQQVASICRDTYFDIVSRKELAANSSLGQLLSYGDNLQPTTLIVPDNVQRVEWLTYNKKRSDDDKDQFELLQYVYPEDFLFRSNSLDSQTDYVQTIQVSGGASVAIRTDLPPSIWTSFNDDQIILDSFCSDFEDTIQGIHTQSKFFTIPSFTISDNFVPDLPTEMFAMYLAECKAASFVFIKDAGNAKAEEVANRQRYVMSQKGWKSAGGIQYADYGRASRKTGSKHFDKWATGSSTYPSGGPLLD